MGAVCVQEADQAGCVSVVFILVGVGDDADGVPFSQEFEDAEVAFCVGSAGVFGFVVVFHLGLRYEFTVL